MLKLYNDLTKKKEYFKALEKVVKVYSCGPTIYDYAHIGNLRTFSYEDLLARFLRYKGYQLVHVRNLTDVDDKIIRNVREQNKTLKEYTDFYAKAFFEDIVKLHFIDCKFYPRATEFIDQIVDFILDLVKKGYAYQGEDSSYYFSINKFKKYGKLSGFELKDLKQDASGRTKTDEYGKDSAKDFALWKAYVPEDGTVFWETKLGKGRPGWHIECSVMANTLLGKTIDIHSGGEDLIFPHHENEIAQSESHNDIEFARFWIHSKHLMVDGKKMSKSLGNFYTLRDIEAKGFNPIALKLLYLLSHYKSQLNFTFESLTNCQTNLQDFNLTIAKLTNYNARLESDTYDEVVKTSENYLKDFIKALEDDLNTPIALAVLFEFSKYVNGLIGNGKIKTETARKLSGYFKKYDSLLGLFNFPEKADDKVVESAWKRFDFRKEKKFAESDQQRDEITKSGWKIDDIQNGFILIKN